MGDFVRNISFCVEVVQDQLPIVLVYYSHLPVIFLSLFFAIYVLIKNKRDILSSYFFTLNFLFALWVTNDLITWVLLYDSALTMFAWSTLELIEVSFFFVCMHFAFFFLYQKRVPGILVNILLLIPLLPIFYFTISGSIISSYDTIICEAIENKSIIHGYVLFADLMYLVIIVGAYLVSLFKRKGEILKNTIFFGGLSFFLAMYLAASYSADYLEDYNWSLIALAGMPVFLAIISFSAVRYKIFKFKILATQILVFMSIFLVGSQFSFIRNQVNIILNSVTLIFLLIGGVLLIRSVKRVDEQKEHIELLAKDLQKANDSQVALIHFITHQIKGFLTKSRNIFAALQEADGQIPAEFKEMVNEGFSSDTKAVTTVQDILKASNIQKGKIEYKKESFDFKEMVTSEFEKLKLIAEKKGINLLLNVRAGDFAFVGDHEQLSHAVRNLIDNAIKYTPKGDVNVVLEKVAVSGSSLNQAGKIRFSVKDSGVGITNADMKRLFTEGGRGENSVKVNVESTGYGLFIVKGIVEAHGGRVWAESEGVGKGSEFIVEL